MLRRSRCAPKGIPRPVGSTPLSSPQSDRANEMQVALKSPRAKSPKLPPERRKTEVAGSLGRGNEDRAACLPKVDKRGKYTMRARVAMPCTCAWQRHGRARGVSMHIHLL